MSVTKIFHCLFLVVLVFAWNRNTLAAVHYVNLNSPNPQVPYSTWGTAATTIQDAIDSSFDGDQVLVTNGVYETGGRIVSGTLSNRVVVARAIVVQSINGPAATIIKGYQVPGTTNGNSAVRCIYLTNNSTLIGFTLTNGATRGASAPVSERDGGGVFCRPGATVSNCIVIGNAADFAGGGALGGSVLDCFLVRNVSANGGGAANAQLTNCVVTQNLSSGPGGGAYACSAASCVLSNNFAYNGGGSANGSTVVDSMVSDNVASNFGGGSYSDTLTNCSILHNTAALGGGTYSSTANRCNVSSNSATSFGGGACNGTLRNCALTRNTAPTGGACSTATLYNCTATDNRATTSTGGANGGTLINSIIYYNDSPDSANVQSPSVVQNSCTTTLWGGPGNTTAEPLLADGIHLSADSPCRDAANPAGTSGKDIDGESWNTAPSIGCDEFSSGTALGPLTVSFSSTYTNFAPDFAVDFVGLIDGRASANRWEFGDGTIASNRPSATHAWTAAGDYPVVFRVYNESNPGGVSATSVVHVIAAVYHVSRNNPSPLPPYSSWQTAATNIQDAIDADVTPGSLVLVTNGLYDTGGMVINGLTNRVAVTKLLTLRSVNGPLTTIIQGSKTATNGPLGDASVRCAYLATGSAIIGFTLTNGATKGETDGNQIGGGGVYCESGSILVSNCVLVGNNAYQGGGAAGGTLDRCILYNNGSGQGGAASGTALRNCRIYYNTNTMLGSGGGTYGCTLTNCFVGTNSADIGGGVASSTATNCLLIGNISRSGGGGADYSTLINCALWLNQSALGGGANNSKLYNCTVVSNLASSGGGGGGLFLSQATNCIVYYNTNSTASNYANTTFGYTCTVPLPSGAFNFSNAPLFIYLLNGNLRLQSNSPCISAGNNAYVRAAGDLDGRARVVGGTVDVGAYEYQGAGIGEFCGWLQSFDLATDGSADFNDSDGDGFNNWQEWRANTNPTDKTSLLRMLIPNGPTISWQSATNVTYYLQRRTNLSVATPFSSIQSNISGQANSTTYFDATATNRGPYFYRVGVQ